MRPLNVKLARISQDPAGAESVVNQPRSADQTLEFVGDLARRHAITGDPLVKFTAAIRPGREKKLRDLWAADRPFR